MECKLERNMRTFVAALVASVVALSVSDIANAGDSDRFMASAMWNACNELAQEM